MKFDKKTLEELSSFLKTMSPIDKDFLNDLFSILLKERFCTFRDAKIVFGDYKKHTSSNIKKFEVEVNMKNLQRHVTDWVNIQFPKENKESKEELVRHYVAFILLHEYFHFDQKQTSVYGDRYREVYLLYRNIFYDITDYEKFKRNYAKCPEEFCYERNANLCALYNMIKISPKVMAEKFEEMYLKFFAQNYSFEGNKIVTPARKTFEMMGKFYFSEKFYTPRLERFIHGLSIRYDEYKEIIIPVRNCTDVHAAYEEVQLKLTS